MRGCGADRTTLLPGAGADGGPKTRARLRHQRPRLIVGSRGGLDVLVRYVDANFQLVQCIIFEYFPPGPSAERVVGLAGFPISGFLVVGGGVEFRAVVIGTDRARGGQAEPRGHAQPSGESQTPAAMREPHQIPAPTGSNP